MTVTHGGNIFEAARQRGCDWRDMMDFSASINPLGPAPGVLQAIVQALDRIAHYPEREPAELKGVLAAKWGVAQNQILLGNGATELIHFLARVFHQRPVCLCAPVFSEFHRAFPQARLVTGQDSEDWPAAGVTVLTRPVNPTGSLIQADCIEAGLVNKERILVVDESFIEFSGAPSVVSMVARYPNLVVLRSLTKFYALPGLRIGALVASEQLVRSWQTIREPWQVNVLASEAAIAALHDEEHAQRSMAFVASEREWLAQECKGLRGSRVQHSYANFLHVQLDYTAASLQEHLLERNILIRACSGWPGVPGESVRIAVRTRRENVKLLDAWRNF